MSAEPDFEALIEACFQHPYDEQVYQRFCAVFRPYLTAVLIAMYPYMPSLAQKALQLAFLRFIEIFQTYRKPAVSCVDYVIAVAKNCLVDEICHHRQYAAVNPIDELFAVGFIPGQLFTEDQTWLRVALIQVMLQLDRRCQFTLESYYIRGMRAQELARRLKIQTRSVHMAVERCRNELRSIVQDYYNTNF
jgi:RNA polymerase sigma factor (sigma-70 family)